MIKKCIPSSVSRVFIISKIVSICVYLFDLKMLLTILVIDCPSARWFVRIHFYLIRRKIIYDCGV